MSEPTEQPGPRYVLVRTVAATHVLDTQAQKLVGTGYDSESAELIARALNDQDNTELVDLRMKLRVLAGEIRTYGTGRSWIAEALERILDGDA